MKETEQKLADDEIVNYMPAMPNLSGGPLRRFVGRLFRRRGTVRADK